MGKIKKVTALVLQASLAKEDFGQFVRFVFAGGVCAMVEMGLYVTLRETYGKEYWLYFNTFAFLIALCLNYWLSRAFVFEPGRHSTEKEFATFILMGLIALGLNNMVIWVAEHQLDIHYQLGKIIAIGSVVVFNFFTKKYLIFKN